MWRNAGLAALLSVLSTTALAGASCDAGPTDPAKVLAALTAAAQAERVLNQYAEDVALIARTGQDLSAYGVKYSHMAFAYRVKSKWYVLHKLNECGTAVAGIFEQGLSEFFLDSKLPSDAAIWPLASETAQALTTLLSTGGYLAFHERRYSMVQYPYSVQYQNSNGWVLEVLAAAVAHIPAGREAAQSWIKSHNYAPSVIEIGWADRLSARITQAHIAFDDHPAKARYAGHIATVTVDSVMDFAVKNKTICQEPDCPAHIIEVGASLSEDQPD